MGRVVLIVIAVLVAIGILGAMTSKNYHCHYITVGNSQVCQ